MSALRQRDTARHQKPSSSPDIPFTLRSFIKLRILRVIYYQYYLWCSTSWPTRQHQKITYPPSLSMREAIGSFFLIGQIVKSSAGLGLGFSERFWTRPSVPLLTSSGQGRVLSVRYLSMLYKFHYWCLEIYSSFEALILRKRWNVLSLRISCNLVPMHMTSPLAFELLPPQPIKLRRVYDGPK